MNIQQEFERAKSVVDKYETYLKSIKGVVSVHVVAVSSPVYIDLCVKNEEISEVLKSLLKDELMGFKLRIGPPGRGVAKRRN